MIVGLHSPSLLGASTESNTRMDVAAKRELEEFVDACMARWDSIKASRCQSEAYNNDKDKAPVVSKRKKRSRQETLEASSFFAGRHNLRRKLPKRKERKEWEMENLSLALLHSCLSR